MIKYKGKYDKYERNLYGEGQEICGCFIWISYGYNIWIICGESPSSEDYSQFIKIPFDMVWVS